MAEKNLSITLRKTIVCKAGAKVLDLLNRNEGKPLAIKSIIGKEKLAGKWPVFLDGITEDKSTLYGLIESFEKDGQMLDDADIEDLLRKNYKILLSKADGQLMMGEVVIEKEEGAANQMDNDETWSAIQEVVEDKISQGILSEEDWEKRKNVLKENGVDPFLVLRVVRKYRSYNRAVHHPSCIYQDPYLESRRKKREEGIIAEGLRAAVSRHAIICEGEKSVGKNVYLETIAWLMGMPMYLITFTRQMSPSSIYGEKSTDNSASEKLKESMDLAMAKAMMETAPEKCTLEDMKKAAQFELLKAQSASVNIVIDASELYDWVEDGGLMCFNEQNMAEANFFASFTNQLLDGTGFLFFPGRGDIPINPDCVLFGTQNADYTGVEMQNEATVSRFGCLYFPQPESIMAQLKAAVKTALKKDGFEGTSLKDQFFKEADAFYKHCRKAILSAAVTNACLNIRGFVRALTEVAESDGYTSLKRQIEIHVIDTCPIDEREALRSFLGQLVTL